MYIHMAGKTKRRCAITSVEQLFSKLYFNFAVEKLYRTIIVDIKNRQSGG